MCLKIMELFHEIKLHAGMTWESSYRSAKIVHQFYPLWIQEFINYIILQQHVSAPRTSSVPSPPQFLSFVQCACCHHYYALNPKHELVKVKGSLSVMSDSQRPHGPQPTRLLHPWDFPGKSIGVGCHCLLRKQPLGILKKIFFQCHTINIRRLSHS